MDDAEIDGDGEQGGDNVDHPMGEYGSNPQDFAAADNFTSAEDFHYADEEFDETIDAEEVDVPPMEREEDPSVSDPGDGNSDDSSGDDDETVDDTKLRKLPG